MIMYRIPVRDDVGQAFVELAFVVPVLILLLLGAVELGRLAYADIEVSNAARAGVAYAMQSNTKASDSTGIQNAAKQDAPDITGLIVDNNGPPTLTCYCETAGVAAASSCTTINTGSVGPGACASPSIIVEYVQVNTSATIDTAFHFVGIPSSVTLQGLAIMRVER
jgi:Flp pilus assembly protein TadG